MDIKTASDFAQIVRTRRRELKVTQRDLAMTCGTGLRFIVDLEKGKATCHLGKALSVAQALGLQIDAVPLDPTAPQRPPQ
jgi:y4mF family transcriptional regulator